jgi:hypothetical protein
MFHQTTWDIEFKFPWWSRSEIMLNVQHKVHVTCKLHWTCTNYIEHVQIKLLNFFLKTYCGRIARYIFNTFHKKWRQVNPRKRQENDQTWLLFFIISPFVHYYFLNENKNQHIHFFGVWPFFLVHIRFILSEGPKGFVILLLIFKSDQGSWTIKSDHGKMPSSMVCLHGPCCKLTLDVSALYFALPKRHAHGSMH